MLITMLLAAAFAAVWPPACSVGELRTSPGYQYTVGRIQDFVDSAEVVVLATAVATDRVSITYRDSTSWWPAVRFQTLEVLRGEPPAQLVLWGRTVATDDFNPQPVPYRMVRRSGQRGDCFASEYKIGGEYLLLLRHHRGELTARWKALAPLNEQVRGVDDPWVKWVRERIAKFRDKAPGD